MKGDRLITLAYTFLIWLIMTGISLLISFLLAVRFFNCWYYFFANLAVCQILIIWACRNFYLYDVLDSSQSPADARTDSEL